MTITLSSHSPDPDLEEKSLEEELAYPILLSDRVRKWVLESTSFKSECSVIATQVDTISHILRSLVRFATSPIPSPIYDRPIRRVLTTLTRNFNRALALLGKCRSRSFFYRVLNLVTAADFRRVNAYLDASAADLRWLISVLGGAGIVLSLPPIASNDPILSWVWSYVATVQMSGQLSDRVEASSELALLAQDNDRNKKIIVEEGGIPPLLKLLKENSSQEAQLSAAITLYNLGYDRVRVRVIVENSGIPLIVQVLSDSMMNVQIRVSDLVARMAEFDDFSKEEFGRENVVRPLVSLLSFETFENENFDVNKFSSSSKYTIPSIVEINREKERRERKDLSRLSSSYSSVSSKYSDGGSSRGGVQSRKEREMESPEVKRELKISCARALWMLAKDSESNSRRITETKGLLCLAKLIEKENVELRVNCLMTIMEITSAAESNVDLRRSAFKTNSPSAKAVVEQLLRMIKESNDPIYQIPAIRSIGSLSRTFPARETRVIGPLVEQLSSKDAEVGAEAAIALGKFVNSDNFLRLEHTRSIIEFNAVIPLMRLLRNGNRAQVHGLILLCYLSIHASDTQALEQARVFTALEGSDRSVAAQNPQLKELISQAIKHLDLYRGDIHTLRQSSWRI